MLSLIVRQNLVSGSHVIGFGICSLKLLDLKRYGCGGCCIILYAITLLGWTTYSSPVLSDIWWMRPLPESARRPRPETSVLPQCDKLLVHQHTYSKYSKCTRDMGDLTIFVFSLGDRLRVCPVHASSAFRCATIQSSLPSRCTTTSDVTFDFVDMRAL